MYFNLLFALFFAPWGAAQASTDGKPSGVSVVVEVREARNDQGNVYCALYDSPRGFPSEQQSAIQGVKTKVSGGQAVCTFKDVKPGAYAVSVLHDEDGDEKMATGWFGIPKEGVGASTDPKLRMGPPRFEDAKFEVKDKAVTVPATLKYL